jgi:F0F1-type ATP synthase delta subunit
VKYQPRHYAIAFREALESGVEYRTAKENLLAALGRKGDRHRFAQVVREIERFEAREVGGRMVTIEFAREMSDKKTRELTKAFAPKDRVTTQIRPELIAGARVMIDDERELDLSLRGRMRALFT